MTDKKTILAPCPDCHAHVQIDRAQPTATCPFCEASFGAAESNRSMRLVGRIARGTGIAAASMVSLSMLAACSGDDDVEVEDVGPDVEQDGGWNEPETTMTGDVYGAPADVGENGPNNLDAPVYGLPSDAGFDEDVEDDQ